jgi:LacI family transcriptional regulator
MTDVASAAGVSLKTVSRVVNEESGVRPETAALVQEAIAKLGFRRNDYDAAELGRRAAERLVLRQAGDTQPPQRIALPAGLIPPGSGEVRP